MYTKMIRINCLTTVFVAFTKKYSKKILQDHYNSIQDTSRFDSEVFNFTSGPIYCVVLVFSGMICTAQMVIMEQSLDLFLNSRAP